MSDRIDTDAKPSDLRAWLTARQLAPDEAQRMMLALLDDREALRAEVDALHAQLALAQEARVYVRAYAEGYVGNPRQQSLARLALDRLPVEEP